MQRNRFKCLKFGVETVKFRVKLDTSIGSIKLEVGKNELAFFFHFHSQTLIHICPPISFFSQLVFLVFISFQVYRRLSPSLESLQCPIAAWTYCLPNNIHMQAYVKVAFYRSGVYQFLFITHPTFRLSTFKNVALN